MDQQTLSRLKLYNLLLTVRPSSWDTKYPYDTWTPKKIIFTQKEIKLRTKDTKVKGGGGDNPLLKPIQVITFEDFVADAES